MEMAFWLSLRKYKSESTSIQAQIKALLCRDQNAEPLHVENTSIDKRERRLIWKRLGPKKFLGSNLLST